MEHTEPQVDKFDEMTWKIRDMVRVSKTLKSDGKEKEGEALLKMARGMCDKLKETIK